MDMPGGDAERFQSSVYCPSGASGICRELLCY